jgi:hypothetical protein
MHSSSSLSALSSSNVLSPPMAIRPNLKAYECHEGKDADNEHAYRGHARAEGEEVGVGISYTRRKEGSRVMRERERIGHLGVDPVRITR